MSNRRTYCKLKAGPPTPSDVYLFADTKPGPKSTTIHMFTCWGCKINSGYSRTWQAAKRHIVARQILQHLQEHTGHGDRVPDHVIALIETEAMTPAGDDD